MPGVPSNKACERCKKRHLKCDETRPSCRRCTAAGEECPGYVQTRKFIDQGATVRRRYAPYQETHPKPDTPFNPGPVTADNVSDSQPHAVQRAGPHELRIQELSGGEEDGSTRHLRMVRTELDSSDDSMMTETLGPPSWPGVGAVDPQRSVSNEPDIPSVPDVNSVSGFEKGSGSTRSTIAGPVDPNASVRDFPAFGNAYNTAASDEPDSRRIVSSERWSQRNENQEFQEIVSELATDTEHETAFLIRHFSDVVGPWLDLSDNGKFFAVYVPIRAINNLSLRYAIAALASKHLGRVKGAKTPTGGGMVTRPATMQAYPNATQVDWFLKGTNYYYLAASSINAATSDGYSSVSSSAVLESPVKIVSRWLKSQLAQAVLNPTGQDPDNISLLRKTEEILATGVLLVFYRLLDITGDEWHMFLSGIRSLFEPLLDVHPISSAVFPHGIRAVFWNFARLDYLGSYFTRSPTHLDPENLLLWRAAGISIDSQDKFHIVSRGAIESSQEDQAINGLTWLVSKVVNFLAQSKQSQLAQWTGSPPVNSPAVYGTPAGAGKDSYPDTNIWLRLCFDFQTWFEGVPETFRPCVRIEHPRNLEKLSDGSHLPFPEIFHSLPACAAAMQHYHFGRIALLLNRPADVVSAPSTAFDRLQGYREVTKEVEYRCREVCGIALGRPHDSVRIYMVPLLFAIGQCLESVDEHQIVVDLLRGMEADLGWPTEYAVQKLQDSWNR